MKNPAARALDAWIEAMTRHALWVVAITLVATVLAGVYAFTHLSMDTDDSDLISAKVGWRQDYIDYQNAFPVYTDNLVVVIDGANPGVAGRATDTLAAAMRKRSDLFAAVYEPGGGAFFARNGLLYLKPDKLHALANRLTTLQPFLGRLSATPTLPTFFDLLGKAMAPDAPVDLDLSPVFDQLNTVFSAQAGSDFGDLSWQQLIGGDQPGVSKRRFIIARPKLDYSRLLAAEPAMNAVRTLARKNGLDSAHGVRVRQTGEAALSDQELASVTHGVLWGALAALAVVAALLYIGLRSWMLMGVSLVTLLAGLVGTAAFAALAVGRLNLISIAFAVLYIGLGIDYAIHVCLRYREALAELAADTVDRASGVRTALVQAIGDVGASLGLCALTTAAGFFAFIPTSYSGVAELGLISGAGMFISLIVSLTFLPAAIALAAPWVPSRPGGRSRAPFIGRTSQWVIWVVAIVVAVAAALALPKVHFDADTLDLKNPDAESVKTYRDLMTDGDHSPLTLVTTRDSLAKAQRLAQRIGQLPTVSSAITIADFVPAHQQEKLATIGDLALTLALSPPDMSQRADFAARKKAIADFSQALDAYRARRSGADPAAARLAQSLAHWRSWFAGQPPARQQEILAGLYRRVFGGFARQISRLSTSLSASRITLSDLPEALKKRWIGRHGGYRIEVSPKGDLSKAADLAAFVARVQQIAPHITGAPKLQIAAGRTVSHAFVMAFIYAGIFITLFLLVLLRSVADTLRVLAPLALSGLILTASTVWFGLPFNFANVIALPLLLGVGVDSGIHVVHRLRRGHDRHAFLATSTARAVLLSSLTTMAGFGSLAFSQHAGTASMGQLLSIGMLAILATTLILVPALFAAKRGDDGLKE